MTEQRKCGQCQLCCKLLPMTADARSLVEDSKKMMLEMGWGNPTMFAQMTPDFNKPAGKKCEHQKFGCGCAIYNTRPMGCRFWICAWLAGADLPRPDHCHYVVDSMTDEIQVDGTAIAAIQVWVDPKYPNAHREKRLRDFLDAVGRAQGFVGLVRFDQTKAIVLIPPSVSGREWIEHTSGCTDAKIGRYGIMLKAMADAASRRFVAGRSPQVAEGSTQLVQSDVAEDQR